MGLVASMPMDDWPERHAEVDVGWAATGPPGGPVSLAPPPPVPHPPGLTVTYDTRAGPVLAYLAVPAEPKSSRSTAVDRGDTGSSG
jgi:hypothetical protein